MIVALCAFGHAQEIEIESFHKNGEIEWFGSAIGTTSRVEWTSTLSPPGNTNWATLDEFEVTDLFMAADVPMLYRVVGTPAEPVSNATLYANQHCLTSGLVGSGENTNRYVNIITGVGGEYTINVSLSSLHIGGDTTQVFLFSPKSPTGLEYHVLNPGNNTVVSRNGEFSLFFADQTQLADNSGSATVTFTGPASTQVVLYANQHCITTGLVGSGDSSNRVVNIISGVGADYVVDATFNSVHIGGDTSQAFLMTTKSPSGLAYHVLNPGRNRITSRNGEFSIFFADQTHLGDNSGSATLDLYR